MKKTLFFILMILVLIVSSCNLFLNEEYGELILSFDGTLPDGARALDSNGLPVLSSSRMKIDIIKENGYTVTRELSAEEPKSLVELVPVGETIEIIVTAINPSGQWSGMASHTVVSGQNHVRVLLNKNVSGLNNLLFTQTVDVKLCFNLTLYMGGKEIMAPGSKPPAQEKPYSFARDSKGRLYVRYKDSNVWLVRYTSEGELDVHPAVTTTIKFLANDYTTGKMYGTDGANFVEIRDDLTPDPVSGAPSVTELFAVDNGRVAWLSGSSGASGNIKINAASLTGASHSDTQINSHINIAGCMPSEVNDLFIRGDYVYVLFTTVNESITSSDPNLYSLGGIVRYNINNLTAPPVKIGFSDSVSFENRAVPSSYYSKNFYGAIKVIGFDEENIYIADDGFDAAYFAESPRIVKNRNRIAALNMETNALSFLDERTAKWYNEWKERRAPDTKTIVWNKVHDENGAFKKTIFKEQGASDNLFETASNREGIFTFDQSGTLYIPHVDGFDNKIKRFVQNENGSYEENKSCQITNFPDFIAADTSCSLKFVVSGNDAYYNVLYYANYSSNLVERLVWQDNFGTASKDIGYSAAGAAISSDWEVTALAANKDGLFVALRKQDSGTHTYGIKIERYAKDSGALSGSVILVPEGTSGTKDSFRIDEKITALHIQDGILYALTAKEMKDSSPKQYLFSSGKLWYISGTADFGDSKRVLYASSETSSEDDTLEKNFTPCRFIAVKPKKLVIASDGYYAKEPGWYTPKNFDKVVTFDIGSWTPLGEPVENTTFTTVLTVSAGYHFLP
ncbi:hypothetical protein [Treponema putidum]|uniref:hypothetical protein n=1 Tax=Treponema putidum TaxID=221027 RepID=UPI0021035760|nr:hypothetical protein [Treponema putidum]UTY30901.1 hypothetical protein E4N75_04640 [Treponema putidum]